jgi:CMP-N-acetylneuraminic acid synthetase
MRNLGKVLAHIPARAGSKRVKAKNLRLLNGKPLLAYSVEAALNAKSVFDGVYINSDSDEMLRLASELGAKTYKRSEELASDTATGDEFTYDFILKEKPDTLVMINPVCPLIESSDIIRAIDKFKSSQCDTLITCEETQMQTFCENNAVNIDADEQLQPTQHNPVVQILNWAVTVWDAKAFVENFEKYGSAYIGKKRELLAIDPIKAVKISKEEDFALAEALIRSKSLIKKTEPVYWS